MYVDPILFHLALACAELFALTLALIGIVLLRAHKVGGLTFCRLGRLGFSFYIRRNA